MACPFDLITGTHFSLFEDKQLNPGTASLGELFLEIIDPHQNTELETRYARLGDFYQSAADAEPVTDAHVFIGHAFNVEVLAELTGRRKISRPSSFAQKS